MTFFFLMIQQWKRTDNINSELVEPEHYWTVRTMNYLIQVNPLFGAVTYYALNTAPENIPIYLRTLTSQISGWQMELYNLESDDLMTTYPDGIYEFIGLGYV